MNTEEKRNKIGWLKVENNPLRDNLWMTLLLYFSYHCDRPDQDEDPEHGYSEWVNKKTIKALDLIARQLKL